jgi:hypothetical protein
MPAPGRPSADGRSVGGISQDPHLVAALPRCLRLQGTPISGTGAQVPKSLLGSDWLPTKCPARAKAALRPLHPRHADRRLFPCYWTPHCASDHVRSFRLGLADHFISCGTPCSHRSAPCSPPNFLRCNRNIGMASLRAARQPTTLPTSLYIAGGCQTWRMSGRPVALPSRLCG